MSDVEEQIRALPHVDAFTVGFEKRVPRGPSRWMQSDLRVHVLVWRAWCNRVEYGAVLDLDPAEPVDAQKVLLLTAALDTLRQVKS